MDVEVQHTQRLNLNNDPIGLQDTHNNSLSTHTNKHLWYSSTAVLR
jgi:hypothetical protein